MQDYERRYPRGFGLLLHATGYSYDGSAEGLRAIAQIMWGVEFCLPEEQEALERK